jgi:N6-adenosine-specific RNA methylase IME4
MDRKYQVIVADPCWSFSDKLTMSDVKRGAASNYPTMSLTDLKSLPIKEIADPEGAILALWVPSSLLQQGLELMSAYGFQQKQSYIWVKVKKNIPDLLVKSTINNIKKYIKDNLLDFTDYIFNYGLKDLLTKSFNFSLQDTLSFGMGRLFRQTHEICLIGTNNNKIYQQLQNKSQRSVSFAPNLKHSAKPEHLQDSLELMFPNANKIEMFARRLRPGWECLGNEVQNGLDIREALAKLIGAKISQ